MDSSASRQVKRPRSTTPAKGDSFSPSSSPPKKKGKKKKESSKKIKANKGRSSSLSGLGESSGGGGGGVSSTAGSGSALLLGSTATTASTASLTKSNKPARESQTASAQGQMMAQMLSTFSKVEQSRFEAFQRARLAPPDVCAWVAACLSDRWQITPTTQHRRSLADLCAVGQAPEITLVVSVLAKIYAQRLVQTAVKLRQERNNQSHSNGDNDNDNDHNQSSSNSSETKPLTVEDLQQAWQERQREGLDPGFFLQSAQERPKASLTRHHNQRYAQQRLAALEAQEQYEKSLLESKGTSSTATKK